MRNIITDNKANKKELTLAVIPLPKDLNAQEVVFGGWTLQQIDLAGSVPAMRIARKDNAKAVTKTIQKVDFIAPVHVGDRVEFYTEIIGIEKRNITVATTVIAERFSSGKYETVAEAEVLYVSLPDRLKERI